MKAEQYRAYYLANREKILAANRAKAAERRKRLKEADDTVKEIHRIKLREKENKRRIVTYKTIFEELARIIGEDNEWSIVYKMIANLPNLHEITPTTMSFLTSLHNNSIKIET